MVAHIWTTILIYFSTFEAGLGLKKLNLLGVNDVLDAGPDTQSRPFNGFYNDSSIRLSTTVAEISRLAASGITKERGDSITSSVTIILRRTGKQCIK